MKPLIGITTYGRDEKNHFVLPAEYCEAVQRAGGVPVLLPPGASAADTERWLEAVDGVMLAGGGDIDPARYDGASHETIYMIDRERDETELALARRIIAAGRPTLGICRGIQTVNVALGGTLHAHVPEIAGESIAHRLPPREPTSHAITVEAGTKLAGITGDLKFDAPSWHHQAIDRVADSLRVTAHAPDGIIEAVEMPDHHWLIAVQWHPELSAKEEPVQQRIFDALTAATRK